jgi:tetratricopeptide (TPR) repeat protein
VLRGFTPEGVRCPSCKRVVVQNSHGELVSLDIPDEKPSVSDKKRKKGEKFFFKGIELLKQMKFDEALVKFNKAIKLNPYDKRVYSVKMEVLLKKGKVKEAAECAKEGMKYFL